MTKEEFLRNIEKLDFDEVYSVSAGNHNTPRLNVRDYSKVDGGYIYESYRGKRILEIY